MSWVLVVQPDSIEADAVHEALHASVSEDIVVVPSLVDALALIDQGIPDLILLPTLIPAAVEDYLIRYIATLPGAQHVQILGLPRLQHSDREVEPPARSLFPWRRRHPPRAIDTAVCDSRLFTRDVIAYLAGARTLKAQAELYTAHARWNAGPERRAEARFANDHVPWISSVRLGGDRTILINLSSRGALVRTRTRPDHRLLRRSEPNARERPRLTLELDTSHELHAAGRVVRCLPLTTSAPTRYEVAFAFDEAVGLHLPALHVLVPARQVANPSPLKSAESIDVLYGIRG